jgi:hypothetical protein
MSFTGSHRSWIFDYNFVKDHVIIIRVLWVQFLKASIFVRIIEFYETLHSCITQPADVHEGIPLLSKI